ncbi:MAG: aldo/keto reductase, partial [Gammaproteobacteria bacterium]|nr:aldo/keto reductase [Gammaproteobacteria bacterium]
QGIAVTSFSPLARGWLSGNKDRRSAVDAYYNRNYGDALDLEIIAKVEAIAEEHGTTMAQVALAWVYSKTAICCPIVTAGSVDQLDKNVEALDIELTQDEIESVNAHICVTVFISKP